jgi:hypothetical protein
MVTGHGAEWNSSPRSRPGMSALPVLGDIPQFQDYRMLGNSLLRGSGPACAVIHRNQWVILTSKFIEGKDSKDLPGDSRRVGFIHG